MESKELVGACIVGQSGGPTAVINASAYGVIRTALESKNITRVYGAAHGIKGILDEVIYDMAEEAPYELSLLMHTPSAALGSCRYKLKNADDDETDYQRILEIFKKYDIRYFFYIGGNDSMDTCSKVSSYLQKVGYPCRVIGIPKTIDNDLALTDHCPGFASAAKYVATSCMELYHDASVYDRNMICIVEIMGRHAGWLAGAAAAAAYMGQGPDLVYLPETDFDMDQFIEDVERLYEMNGECFIAVSEGIHDKDGTLISEYGADSVSVDAFGHKQLGGLAATLVNILKGHLGNIKMRGIELSLLQRCAAHCASETDVQEAFKAGKAAVEFAINGVTDKMVGFTREYDEDNEYTCDISLFDLMEVANAEKKVPREWINEKGNGLTQEYIDYVLPLIKGAPKLVYENSLPRFAHLRKIPAKLKKKD